MTAKLKIGLAVVIVGFLALVAVGSGTAARERGEKDAGWSRQAEEMFYLSPGLGEKILSRNQWNRFQKKMKNMPPEQLSSFRLEMHKILMQEARDRHINPPGLSPQNDNQRDVKSNTEDRPLFTFISAATSVGGTTVFGGGSGTSGILPQTTTLSSACLQPAFDKEGCLQDTMNSATSPTVVLYSQANDKRVLTSRDADRMFGTDPSYSTRRSVDSFDDSRGAIFHRDFDIGSGRDRDRNNW